VPGESKADLKERTARVVAALKKAYPKAGCALDRSNPFELLAATILSAQCTDVRVNEVTRTLFKKYRSVEDFANADQADLENDIRSTGFFRNKARNIRAAAAKVLSDFGGEVPRTMADLLTLPGAARKTANCVLGTAYGIAEGVVVDTHVKRLAGRLGMTTHTDPVKIERDLMDLLPKNDWIRFSFLLIHHGRAVCSARKPDCPSCPINKLCPSAGKV